MASQTLRDGPFTNFTMFCYLRCSRQTLLKAFGIHVNQFLTIKAILD